MEDVKEAKALIRDIRRLKQVDSDGGSDENANDNERALKLLSEELNSKPTHFILELIQNADDNQYENVTPTLKIIYRKDGFLWLGCNELGFSPEHVRAICRIGDSTKKDQKTRKGYIGEKGIGFKSVFKVADIVCIKSGALEFQFDKSKKLGMIAPEWNRFPAHHSMNETTMFCFQIPSHEYRTAVLQDLLRFDAELLLFLRQLTVIKVQIETPSGAVEDSFQRSREDSKLSKFRLSTLKDTIFEPNRADTVQRYIVHKQTALDMPPEPHRKGITESDVLIAFPLDEEFEPRIVPQRTFNFLPIRDYGLHFILHGDFILSTGREDITEVNEWNHHLIDAATDLFVDSVKLFNRRERLKFTWPRYLQSQSGASHPIFRSFLKDLLRRLRSTAILHSRAMSMEKPSDLVYLPDVFTNGRDPPMPLLDTSKRLNDYAAAGYSLKDLAKLQVKPQSDLAFIQLLKKSLMDRPSRFQRRSPSWHERVAQAILHTGKISDVERLALMPLRKGCWVAAKDNQVYFPAVDGGLKLPDGIDAAILDDRAVSTPSRWKLCEELRARALNSAEVNKLLVFQHSRHGMEYGTWDRDIVMSHAWFLFTSQTMTADSSVRKLRVAAKDSNLLYKGEELYMDPEVNGMSSLCDAEEGVVNFIDPGYLNLAPKHQRKAWKKWLRTQLGVRKLPRLVNEAGGISAEFEWFTTHSTSTLWLTLLRDHWSHYEDELESAQRATKIRDTLASSLVTCQDTRERPLQQVFLATTAILNEPLAQATVPMLAVDDANDSRWLRLEEIGLNVRPSLQFYMSVLQSMQTDIGIKPSLEDVQRIYDGIRRNIEEDPDSVKDNITVIYTPIPSPGRWVSIKNCRWKSPACLTSKVALNSLYPNQYQFLVSDLGLENAGASDIVRELKTFSGQISNIETIKELLLVLDEFIYRHRGEEEKLGKLKAASIKVLPVRCEGTELRSCADRDWFIPDRSRLEKCFEGRVHLLDFDQPTLKKLSRVLQALGVQHRTLSDSIIECTEATGLLTYKDAFTKHLQSKVPFVSRLVSPTRRQEVFDQLVLAEVWCSDTIVLSRHVKICKDVIYGRAETGFIVLEELTKRIYVSNASVASNSLPYKVLSEKLVAMLDIDERRESLLLAILATDVVEQIEDMLERANLESDVFEASMAEQNYYTESDDERDVRRSPKDTTSPSISQSGLRTPSRATRRSSSNTRTFGIALPESFRTSNASPPPSQSSNAISPTNCRIRRSAGKQKPRFSIISVADILAAAANLGSDNAAVVGPTTNGQSSGADDSEGEPRRVNCDSISVPDGSRRARASFEGASANHRGVFDLSGVHSALDASLECGSGGRAFSPRPTVGATRVHDYISPSTKLADNYQEEVGYGGELYVYKYLQSRFQAGDSCWTSRMRSHFGLTEFGKPEGKYSDFTIKDRDVSRRITEWLIDGGFALAENWIGENMVYHLEVKTTMGTCDEPFMMTTNQVGLARAWHDRPSDVHIILRVYNLVSSPTFRAYVDPFGQMMAGDLKFTAQGGYYVQPTQ